MRINRHNFNLASAKACMRTSDLRGKGVASSTTLTKITNDADYDVRPDIVGKIAKALNVEVEYLVKEVI